MFVFFSSEIGPVALWFVPARDNPDNPDNTWGSDEQPTRSTSCNTSFMSSHQLDLIRHDWDIYIYIGILFRIMSFQSSMQIPPGGHKLQLGTGTIEPQSWLVDLRLWAQTAFATCLASLQLLWCNHLHVPRQPKPNALSIHAILLLKVQKLSQQGLNLSTQLCYVLLRRSPRVLQQSIGEVYGNHHAVSICAV